MAQIKNLIFGMKIQITFIFVLKLTCIHTRRIENFGSRSCIIISLSHPLTQHIFQLCIQIFSKNFKSIITSPVSWNRVIRVPVTEYYKNQHQKWQNFHEKKILAGVRIYQGIWIIKWSEIYFLFTAKTHAWLGWPSASLAPI